MTHRYLHQIESRIHELADLPLTSNRIEEMHFCLEIVKHCDWLRYVLEDGEKPDHR